MAIRKKKLIESSFTLLDSHNDLGMLSPLILTRTTWGRKFSSEDGKDGKPDLGRTALWLSDVRHGFSCSSEEIISEVRAFICFICCSKLPLWACQICDKSLISISQLSESWARQLRKQCLPRLTHRTQCSRPDAGGPCWVLIET